MTFRPRLSKWLYPGMRIKRWLSLFALGVIVFSMGLLFYVDAHKAITLEYLLVDMARWLTGWEVSSRAVDVVIMLIGLALVVIGLSRWFNSIYEVLVPHESQKLEDIVYRHRQLDHGVRIVTIGGGTGLSSLLRGLKHFTSNLTAIVTVSDDGGSSGRLRKELGVLPPGDIRNCLVALADDESLLSELFNYRFSEAGVGAPGSEATGLGGHSFGNLFLAALTGVAGGDFDKAVKLSSKILAIQGRVLPATLQTSVLCAEYNSGTMCEGESDIPRRGERIKRVFLKPDCDPQPEVITAIQEADVIVLGPGSLFTSVMPNLLVRGVADAVRDSKAVKVYVCNVMTQPGETDRFTASDHLKALSEHTGGRPIVDYCLLNDEVPSRLLKKYEADNAFPVHNDLEAIKLLGVEAVLAPLISETNAVRHDPEKLGEAIRKIVTEKVEGSEVLRLLRRSA